MPAMSPGEVWMIDFGMTEKVSPALLLAGEPADDELDLLSVLLRTTPRAGALLRSAGRPPSAPNN